MAEMTLDESLAEAGRILFQILSRDPELDVDTRIASAIVALRPIVAKGVRAREAYPEL